MFWVVKGIINKILSNSIIRIIIRLLQPDTIALCFVILLYGLILWSVDKGVSIDEGFYLLGYLDNQLTAPYFTDFHNIVRSLFFFLADDDVLGMRIARLIITILALFIFTETSYGWLKHKSHFSESRLLYYGLSFLAGAMCFSYASNTPYYDNLQLIIYLLVFSLLLYEQITKPYFLKLTSHIIIGVLIVVGLTNYPTSGVLLAAMVFIFTSIYCYPSFRNMIKAWLVISGGFVLGILLYSLLIYNFFEFFSEAIWAYTNSAKSSKAKYDSMGQLQVIGKYFLGLAKVYIPVLGLSVIYFFLVYKKLINRILLNIVFGLVLLLIAYKFSVYFSNILLLPVVLLLFDAIINLIGMKIRFRLSNNLMLAMLLLALPLLAVAGSNQRLEMKMMYFMPFWVLAYFILIGEFRASLDPRRILVINYVFIITFFIVFAAQGFLKHIHYNYSIKRSRHLIENAERFTNIGVSEYQQNFYENGIRELKKAGFKKGDKVLAFYKTFMLVYTAGGYVPYRLTYSAEFFVADKDNIPPDKVDYIIIDHSQIAMITDFLKQSDWNFPESYSRTELGTDGHNLTQLGYNYILFSPTIHSQNKQ